MSLLTPEQRSTWRAGRVFWVPTKRGPVRLGVLGDLRYRPLSRPGTELSLCVVPTERDMPLADVWVNLLLVLARQPDRFFAVAVTTGHARRFEKAECTGQGELALWSRDTPAA